MTIDMILLLIGLAAAVAPGSAGGVVRLPAPSAHQDPCDGPGVDPWIPGLRARMLGDDELARFAVRTFGAPIDCRGAVTAEFDGAEFGELTLDFPGGASLEVQTFPPEASVTTLRVPAGFSDEGEVRDLLARYAEHIGLAIDWGSPAVSRGGDDLVQSFSDPDPGLNASASLVFRGDRLVAVRLSMAL